MALRGILACVFALLLLAPPQAAAAGSSSNSGSSKSSGFGKSSSKSGSKSGSKSSSKSGSKSGFGSSKSKSDSSKSSASKSRTPAPKRSSSKGASRTTTAVAPGPVLPSPPVHEDGSGADDVRFRGSYFSEATFARLPCDPVAVAVGDRSCWRCGDGWFEKLVYDGQPGYVAVFAPAGARTDELPKDAQPIRGESGTYFATSDALYAPSEDGSGEYVVVATEPGFRVDELPDAARVGAAIVADGFTYYRYLGVYYREEHDDEGTYYVASESPF
jgi:hypothetical protein